MQDAVLDDTFGDRLAGEIAQVVSGELTGVDLRGQRGNLLVGPAELAQLVVVQEIHAHFGVLRHAVAGALVAHRLPQRHDDVAVQLLILGDVVFEIQRVARFGEGARPFMRQDEDIRAFVDGERFHEVERVVVIALGVGLIEFDLDALVGAGGREHLVQRIACGDKIACAQRSGPVRARPHLDHHIVGQRRRRRSAEQHAADHSR